MGGPLKSIFQKAAEIYNSPLFSRIPMMYNLDGMPRPRFEDRETRFSDDVQDRFAGPRAYRPDRDPGETVEEHVTHRGQRHNAVRCFTHGRARRRTPMNRSVSTVTLFLLVVSLLAGSVSAYFIPFPGTDILTVTKEGKPVGGAQFSLYRQNFCGCVFSKTAGSDDK